MNQIKILFIVLVIFSGKELLSQTQLFFEDFTDEVEGAVIGASSEGVTWNLDCVNCNGIFEVTNGTLSQVASDEPVYFRSQEIDITNLSSLNFKYNFGSIGYLGLGNLELSFECFDDCAGDPNGPSTGTCFNCWDFFQSKLIFEDGSEEIVDLIGVDSIDAQSISIDFNSSKFYGKSSVTIEFVFQSWAQDEWMWVDDIILVGYNNVCSHPDFNAMMEFYYATGGPYWTNSSGWKEGAEGTNCNPCNGWYGVGCNSNGRVKKMFLGNNSLIGILPDINLGELDSFYIPGNQLTDTIPNFSNLPKLKLLTCFSNLLTGGIPDFDDLPNLESMDFSQNSLSKPIPNFTNLPNLKILYCSSNLISGNIPNFSDLPNLEGFIIDNNLITGSIPNFQDIPTLQDFRCNQNLITGVIPDFSNLPNLKIFSCDNNSLLGNIPNFSNLPKLSSFSCTNNALTGTLPNFSYLPNLKSLRCSYNSISGSIPDFSYMPNLDLFSCSNNQLGGTLPDFSNSNLVFFNCSNNLLEGSIPDYQSPPLETFWCDNNKLSGPIPNFTNLPSLQSFRCSQNSLNGNVPDFAHLYNLEAFISSGNNLSGCYPVNFEYCNIIYSFIDNPLLPWEGDYSRYCDGEEQIGAPCDDGIANNGVDVINEDCTCGEALSCEHPDYAGLMEFYNATGGPNWTDNTGWKEGAEGKNCDPCNGWYGVRCENGRVECIDMDGDFECEDNDYSNLGNNLCGFIPDLNLPYLRGFVLNSNKLVGAIPDFSNLPNLVYFSCRSNLLDGNIPNFSNLLGLSSFNCGSNLLTGTIPDFSNIPKLGFFDCSSNSLFGAIPNLSNISNLRWFDCSENSLSGPIPDFSNTQLLQRFFCNDNNLSACFPSNFNFCDIIYDFSNNPLLPWEGDYSRFCAGEDQMGSSCNGTGVILENCECSVQNCNLSFSLSANDFCSGSQSLISVHGGSIQYYLWSNGKTTETITVSQGGSYSVTVSDENGCTSSGSVIVAELAEPTPVISGDNFCSGFQAQLTVAGNYPSYLWSNGETTKSITINNPGTYSVTVNDVDGCEGSAKITISALPLPSPVIVGDSVICFGNESILALDQEYESYLWSTGATTPNLNINSSGVFNVTVTDVNGCSGSASFEINEETHPDLPGLLEVYESLKGSSWKDKSGWEEGFLGNDCDPCSGWFGVTCNDENRVVKIDLTDNNLAGLISEIDLSELEELYLDANSITGSIPNFQGTPKLQSLSLSVNPITGPIPDFTNLNELNSLFLEQCQLSGEIPNFTNLGKLKNIFVKQNNLSGPIPNFSNLGNIETLKLEGNALSGEMPDFSFIPNLKTLVVSTNNLNGGLPSFSNLPKLSILRASENKLTGPIPFFAQSSLTELLLDGNDLSGCYPEGMSYCNIIYDFRNNPLLPWEGDYSRYCAGEEEVGASCDDNDPLTSNTVIDEDCNCSPSCTTPQFSLSFDKSSYCVNDEATMTLAGEFLPEYEYSLTLQGGLLINGSGQEPYQVLWDEVGSFSVSMEITNGECTTINSVNILVEECPCELAANPDYISSFPEEAFSYNVISNDQLPLEGSTWQLSSASVTDVSDLVLEDDGTMSGFIGANFSDTIRIGYELCHPNCEECEIGTLFISNSFLDEIVLTDVISPNGDGVNELLKFSDADVLEESELIIFNRWGDKIFDTEKYMNNWQADGYPGGIYYYVLNYKGTIVKRTLTVLK